MKDRRGRSVRVVGRCTDEALAGDFGALVRRWDWDEKAPVPARLSRLSAHARIIFCMVKESFWKGNNTSKGLIEFMKWCVVAAGGGGEWQGRLSIYLPGICTGVHLGGMVTHVRLCFWSNLGVDERRMRKKARGRERKREEKKRT